MTSYFPQVLDLDWFEFRGGICYVESYLDGMRMWGTCRYILFTVPKQYFDYVQLFCIQRPYYSIITAIISQLSPWLDAAIPTIWTDSRISLCISCSILWIDIIFRICLSIHSMMLQYCCQYAYFHARLAISIWSLVWMVSRIPLCIPPYFSWTDIISELFSQFAVQSCNRSPWQTCFSRIPEQKAYI